MKIQEANNIFKNFLANTKNKSEIKVYQEFTHILSRLEKRNFTDSELKLIEDELSRLDLSANPESKGKYFRKALKQMKEFLRDQFSLVTQGYFINRGLGLGLSFGALIGIVLFSSLERSLGIALGITLGGALGYAIGKSLDEKAVKESRML